MGTLGGLEGNGQRKIRGEKTEPSTLVSRLAGPHLFFSDEIQEESSRHRWVGGLPGLHHLFFEEVLFFQTRSCGGFRQVVEMGDDTMTYGSTLAITSASLRSFRTK